ncbi:MAG TPA: flagellar FlbD family protein [Bryobacteraceae bacterium]|jgi:flagellar protein FlbD|nr:flagellar FlbD family protein [Bryobacteraceae bacterium]
MIQLTRLNRRPLVLNADLIESIEATPDTVISLTTGQKLVVLEPAEEVVRRVVEFRRAIYSSILVGPSILTGQSASSAAPVDGGGNRISYGRDNRTDS